VKLQQLIERYVAFRQSLGERFLANGRILRAFARAIGPDADVTEVRAGQVSAFLAGAGPITSAWHNKYKALLGFYRYARSRDHVAEAPLPAVVPKRPPPFIPYIYSHEDLRRLLRATDSYQYRPSSTEPVTLRTIILLLYGTGLRVREAVNLDRPDVDLEQSLLTVRQTKFFKTRLVPFSPQLGHALAQYVARGPTPGPASVEAAPFFTTRTGARVKQDTIEASFCRVRERAGVRRSDGARYQPRLHDLRHSADCLVMPIESLATWFSRAFGFSYRVGEAA
jgi:integrase